MPNDCHVSRMLMKNSSPAILIPAWNEEATVADVIKKFTRDCPYNVIVIMMPVRIRRQIVLHQQGPGY